MPIQTNYTEACNNFNKIYEEAIQSREPVIINREGAESVAVIPTAELNSIIETAYLFQSPENAARLLGGSKCSDKASSRLANVSVSV